MPWIKFAVFPEPVAFKDLGIGEHFIHIHRGSLFQKQYQNNMRDPWQHVTLSLSDGCTYRTSDDSICYRIVAYFKES